MSEIKSGDPVVFEDNGEEYSGIVGEIITIAFTGEPQRFRKHAAVAWDEGNGPWDDPVSFIELSTLRLKPQWKRIETKGVRIVYEECPVCQPLTIGSEVSNLACYHRHDGHIEVLE